LDLPRNLLTSAVYADLDQTIRPDRPILPYAVIKHGDDPGALPVLLDRLGDLRPIRPMVALVLQTLEDAPR
jgi:hypothetical protein